MVLTEIHYTIPLNEVLLRLQYNINKSAVPPAVKQMIDEMMDECRIVAAPQAAWGELSIYALRPDGLVLNGGAVVLSSAAIAKHCAGCYQVTFLACTIGSAFAERIAQFLAAKEVTKAAILDAAASEAVEAVADSATEVIRREALTQGAVITKRFSPGYGDLALSAQELFCKYSESARIGVSENANHILIPEKSITALIGWMKKGDAPTPRRAEVQQKCCSVHVKP